MNNVWILAQATDEQAPSGISSEPVSEEGPATTVIPAEPNAGITETQTKRPAGHFNLILLGLMLVVMYVLLFRGPQKQKQQRKKMIQSLERNDRVQTIGGIIGTVVDIKGDEVTLKIDESNNTKIRVVSTAIGRNFSKDKD